MKKVLQIVGLLIVVVIVAGGIYVWKSYQSFMKIETIQYDPQLTIYLGGGNSVVLTSEDGSAALVVDTKLKGAAKILRENIKANDMTISIMSAATLFTRRQRSLPVNTQKSSGMMTPKKPADIRISL